jgi:hypothetical protein
VSSPRNPQADEEAKHAAPLPSCQELFRHDSSTGITLLRRQQEETEEQDKADDGAALSADTKALVFTAVLGVVSFVMQARVAKSANLTQREVELARAERGKARELAAVQLERVRSQVGDVYCPVFGMLHQAFVSAAYMSRELGFGFIDVWGWEFVRPFALWPHLEVLSRDWSVRGIRAFKGSPSCKT